MCIIDGIFIGNSNGGVSFGGNYFTERRPVDQNWYECTECDQGCKGGFQYCYEVENDRTGCNCSFITHDKLDIGEEVRIFHRGKCPEIRECTIDKRNVPEAAITIVFIGGLAGMIVIGYWCCIITRVCPSCQNPEDKELTSCCADATTNGEGETKKWGIICTLNSTFLWGILRYKCADCHCCLITHGTFLARFDFQVTLLTAAEVATQK